MAGLLPHGPPTQKPEERKTSSGRKRGPGWGEPRSTGNPTRGLPFRSGPEGEPQGGPEIRLLGNSDSSGSGSCLCSTQRSPEKQNFYYTLLSPRLLPAPRGPTTARAGQRASFLSPGSAQLCLRLWSVSRPQQPAGRSLIVQAWFQLFAVGLHSRIRTETGSAPLDPRLLQCRWVN